MADNLVPAGNSFDADATLLLLAYAATSVGLEIPLDDVAAALTAIGWQTDTGQPIERWDLYWTPVLEVLLNVAGERVDRAGRWRISPGAARLARAALRAR